MRDTIGGRSEFAGPLQLTRKSVRRGSFDSVKALVKHIGKYIDHWNENAVHFIWTREPADIIKKSVRRGR